MPAINLSRRRLLQLTAGGALFAWGVASGRARDTRIARLIDRARRLDFVGERIATISRALVGAPYMNDPLVGGPRTPEQFIVRDDRFDCVTFCETVLAAARSFAPADFEQQLRKIRYRNGDIAWPERNHYFADWAANNIANGVCRTVTLPDAAMVDKRVSYMRGLPAERVSMTAIPTASVFAHAWRLATGDIIGFLSRRPGIDYFHTGFVVVDRSETLWLRHAARSKGRVLDQPLAQFIAETGARHVSLLRPQEVWSGDAIA